VQLLNKSQDIKRYCRNLHLKSGIKLHHEKTQLQRRTLYFTARSFEKSAKAILNFNDSGLSILEISHRSKDFVVMDEANATALNY
jgi:hypothetical protein